jgi:hypothetical protein
MFGSSPGGELQPLVERQQRVVPRQVLVFGSSGAADSGPSSLPSMLAIKPSSQARCAGENGALSGRRGTMLIVTPPRRPCEHRGQLGIAVAAGKNVERLAVAAMRQVGRSIASMRAGIASAGTD